MIDAPRYPDAKTSNGINRGQLWIDGGNNITISNIIFTGRNSKGGYNPSNRQEYDHNVRVVGASQVTIDNIVAQKSNGDGVAIMARGPWSANGKGAIPATYVTVKNSRFSGNGRQGVTVQNGSNITITQNNFNEQYYWPIDLEQHLPLHSIKKITISKNTVTGKTPYGFISLATQDLLTDTSNGQNQGSSDITVDSNVFSANSSSCQEFMTINGAQTTNKNQAPTRGITIINNTMNINQYAVKVNNASGLMVKGNKGTTRTSNSLCAASDSSNAADKVFGMVAAGNNVRDVKIRENSFLRRPGDSERVKTDSFVQVWNAGTKTGAVAGLENCSNNTTQSKNPTSYDQPTICSSSTAQPEAPSIESPSQNETVMMGQGETTSEIKIKGKARPGVSVNISIALGDRVVSNQIVGSDSAGLWSASAILPAGVYRITATQTIGSSISSSLTQQFVVSGAITDTPTRPDVRPPITPPVITNPTNPQTPPDSSSQSLAVLAPSEGQGMQTPNVSTRMLVTVSGEATPGNYVVVSVGTVSQKVRVSGDSKWSIRLTLSIGRYTAHVIELSGAKTVGIADRQFSVVQ